MHGFSRGIHRRTIKPSGVTSPKDNVHDPQWHQMSLPASAAEIAARESEEIRGIGVITGLFVIAPFVTADS